MSQSISAETSNRKAKEDLKELNNDDDVYGSRTLTEFNDETESKKEYIEILTDSDEEYSRRNSDNEIIVDDTDLSAFSDEESYGYRRVVNRNVEAENDNNIQNEAFASIIDDDNIIESSYDTDTFLKFVEKHGDIVNDEISELEEDAVLFESDDESSTFKEEKEKLFTHKEILMQYYNISESDMDKLLNYEFNLKDDSVENKSSCSKNYIENVAQNNDKPINLVKRENEIENLPQSIVTKDTDDIIESDNENNNIDNNIRVEKNDTLRDIVKSIEENTTREFNNSQEDFLGFNANDFQCNNPACTIKGSNSKKGLKRKCTEIDFLERQAKNFIFKKPSSKKPKVLVEKVFSLFD